MLNTGVGGLEEIARILNGFEKRLNALETRDQIFILSTDAYELQSTTRALLVPRMTTVERDALAAVNGMIVFNTTTVAFNGYDGAWIVL